MTSTFRRPRIACEFSPTQVITASAGDTGLIDVWSVRGLPPRALVPTLMGSNLAEPAAVRLALQQTLAVLGSARKRDVAAILPDSCCRLVLIDLDLLPARREEAEVLIRHRVNKSLPFDVEAARISWQAQKVNGKTNVLAAVTHRTVLDEYEAMVRDAGYSPGLVLPSILASLRLVDATVPTLLIKVDTATTSIAVVHDGAVLLVRVLDRTPEMAKVVDDVDASLAFFQDAYGTKVQRILLGSAPPCEELYPLLEHSSGVRPQALLGAERLTPGCASVRSALGAVAGALV